MLTANDRRVMVERHHGWEGASPSLLGLVFDVSAQQATAIVRQVCASCGKPICGHSDDEWDHAHPLTPSRASSRRGAAPVSPPFGRGSEGRAA